MKKLVFIIIILLISISIVKSQVCFPDHGTWNQKYHSIAWGHGGEILWDVTYYNTYRVTGDTTFGDSTFYRLVKNSSLNYFVYEDSEKVYVGSDPSSLRLWFDYSLNPGDTFQFYAPNYSAWPYVLRLQVSSADSVMIQGVMRKHIVFEEIPGYGAGPEWIQGIGDINFGGLEMDYSYVAWYGNTMTLECFTQSGQNIFGVCTLDVPENITNSLVHPNPSSGLFRVNTHESVYPLYIDVLNIEGKRVYSGPIFTKEDALINLTTLAPGVYLLRITDRNGHSFSQKIMIQ
jgi:hypothetical protein